jgi:anthranilate phosphoribosyltransferase
MTRDQAREAMARIPRGDPAPTLGAFWLANRWKRNTPTELAGVADVMREESVAVAAPDCEPVDCGANDDGKRETALLGVRTDLPPRERADMVDETGFGFHSQPNVNPKPTDLVDRHREMGVRTFVYTFETLANPEAASVHHGSFYHLAFATRVTETLRIMETHALAGW